MSDAVQFAVEVIRGQRAVVRLLRSGDVLPKTFDIGFDQLGTLDASWVWVSERQGTITGVLVASPCHGVALIWRLAVEPSEPISTLTRLLRVFLKAIRERKCKGYITWVDPKVEIQAKLKGIIQHVGGGVAVNGMEMLAGSLVRENI